MNGSTAADSKPQSADRKRRTWSDEERDLILRASLKKGTTVNAVAQLYGVQPWQIYDWRKKARQARTAVPKFFPQLDNRHGNRENYYHQDRVDPNLKGFTHEILVWHLSLL